MSYNNNTMGDRGCFCYRIPVRAAILSPLSSPSWEAVLTPVFYLCPHSYQYTKTNTRFTVKDYSWYTIVVRYRWNEVSSGKVDDDLDVGYLSLA
jgi:hypothetical protein